MKPNSSLLVVSLLGLLGTALAAGGPASSSQGTTAVGPSSSGDGKDSSSGGQAPSGNEAKIPEGAEGVLTEGHCDPGTKNEQHYCKGMSGSWPVTKRCQNECPSKNAPCKMSSSAQLADCGPNPDFPISDKAARKKVAPAAKPSASDSSGSGSSGGSSSSGSPGNANGKRPAAEGDAGQPPSKKTTA